MRKLLGHLALAVALLPGQVLADQSFYYSRRVDVIRSGGVETKIIRREFFDPQTNTHVRSTTVIQNNVPLPSIPMGSGAVIRDGIAIHYSQPLRGDFGEKANRALDTGERHLLTARVGIAPRGVDETARENFFAAQEQVRQFQTVANEQALRWSRENEAQLRAQKETVRSLQVGLQNYTTAVDQNLIDSTRTAFALSRDNFGLISAIQSLNVARAIAQGELTVQSIEFSPDRQRQLVDDLPGVLLSDPRAAAEVTSDLLSPLNTTTLPEIRAQLKREGFANGVMPGYLIGAGRIEFRDPYLEDQRIRLQNQMQAQGILYPELFAGEGRDGVRAAQFYLAAAEKAENSGNFDRARELLQEAQQQVRQPFESSEKDLQYYGLALNAYLGSSYASVSLQSTNAQFRQVAEPVGAFLKRTASSGPSSVQPAVRAGEYFLGLADKASVDGRGQLANAFLHSAIAAIDLVTAFVTPVSLVKDSYEALTGLHWLTGKRLSEFEQSLAVAGVVTLGLGGPMFKGVKMVVPVLLEFKLGKKLIESGVRLGEAFRMAGVKSAQTYQRVRGLLRETKDSLQAEKVIVSTERVLEDRMKVLGFKFVNREMHSSDDLNTVIHAVGKDPYYKSGRWIYDIETTEFPKGLIRVFKGDRAEGGFLLHESTFRMITKSADTPEKVASVLKDELNLTYLPTHVARYEASSENVLFRVSEIGQIPGRGHGSGQIQFEILSAADRAPKNFTQIKTIEDVVRSGGL